MRSARLTMRVPVDLNELLAQHRKETGVPTTVFTERTLRAALAKVQRAKLRKPSKSQNQPSVN